MARGLATIERALAADGPLTRQELGRRLHRAKLEASVAEALADDATAVQEFLG